MSRTSEKLALFAAVALILPFAVGIVHAAEPVGAKGKAVAAAPITVEKSLPPPTIDTNKDGKADAWDRDANGLVDAWDTNNDDKPDVFDDNNDGQPDGEKLPPSPPDDAVEPRN
jgi:hypothetical protein